MLIRLASSCARSPTAVRSCPCCPLTIKHPFDSVSDRWFDELYALLLSAAESTTKGQLDARVLALLHHPTSHFPRPWSYSCFGTDWWSHPWWLSDQCPIASICQLRAVDRHLRNHDTIKARRSATEAPVRTVADPCTNTILAVLMFLKIVWSSLFITFCWVLITYMTLIKNIENRWYLVWNYMLDIYQ